MVEAQTETAAEHLSALIDKVNALEQEMGRTDLRAEHLSRIEKVIQLVQLSLQAHKTYFEAEKLQAETGSLVRARRSESARFWLPIIAPLVGSLAVVATLGFQIHQFNENSRLTRETAEASQFREVMRDAKLPDAVAAYTSQALLSSFFSSKTYGPQARAVAVSMLGMTGSVEGFRGLFSSVFPVVTYADLPELTRLARMQNEVGGKMGADLALAKEALETTKKNALAAQNPALADRAVASAQAKFKEIDSQDDDFWEVAALTGEGLATALRQKPSDQNPDLSSALIFGADLSGIRFGQARLADTDFQKCDVTGADFSEVREATGGDWYKTQWWRAGKLNSPLFKYLKEKYPFDPSIEGFYAGKPASQTEYAQRIAQFETMK